MNTQYRSDALSAGASSRQSNHHNLPTHLALRCGCRGGGVCACGHNRGSSGRRSDLSGLPVSCLHHLLSRRAAHCGGCVGAGGCRLCRRQEGGQEWRWGRVRVNSGMESERGLARREKQGGTAGSPACKPQHHVHVAAMCTPACEEARLTFPRHAHKLAAHARPLVSQRLQQVGCRGHDCQLGGSGRDART